MTQRFHRSGHPGSVESGGNTSETVFAAADVHYLPSGGARAAAVVAADTAFSRLACDRIAVVTDVAPYQPGESTCASSRRCARLSPACPA